MKKRSSYLLKKLDRILGIPLVFFLGFFHRSRKPPEAPKKVGVLVSAAIGDTVLAAVIGAALKDRDAGTEVVLVTGSSNSVIAPFLPAFDRSMEISEKKPWLAVPALRKEKFDVLVDTGQWSRLNALLSALSGARFTAGFRTRGQYRHYCYDRTVEHSAKAHELTNFRNLAAVLGVGPGRVGLANYGAPTSAQKYLVFHLLPSGEKSWMKEWPEANWARLAEDLSSEGHEILLTGSPQEAPLLDAFIRTVRPGTKVRSIAGVSFRETLQTIAGAELVVSVNTGIMHIAAVLEKNLVALHGPTDPKRWGPVNSNSQVVQASLGCVPCLNLGFDYGCGTNACMKALEYRSVYGACQTFLAAKQPLSQQKPAPTAPQDREAP